MIDKNLHAAAKKMNVNNLIALKPAVVIGILLEVLASLPEKVDLDNED
ncbi:RNA polymerase subunit sigma-70 [Escherichia coli]|nr:RNA polymerase subunit sigma-70 [Escherichia coli]